MMEEDKNLIGWIYHGQVKQVSLKEPEIKAGGGVLTFNCRTRAAEAGGSL